MTADNPTPKFRSRYLVKDREIGLIYEIERFVGNSLNGDVFYTGFEVETGEKVNLNENWLDLVKKYIPVEWIPKKRRKKSR